MLARSSQATGGIDMEMNECSEDPGEGLIKIRMAYGGHRGHPGKRGLCHLGGSRCLYRRGDSFCLFN